MTEQWWASDPVAQPQQQPAASQADWWSSDPVAQPQRPQQQQINFDRSDEEIRADVSALPAEQRQDALKQWARQRIARDRDTYFKPLPNPMRGVPIIGGLLDEGLGAIDAGLNTISGGVIGRPYDEAVEFHRERFRQAEEAKPILATTGQIAGGLALGGPIGGKLFEGASTAGKMAIGAGLGYGLGNVEGFTRGEGVEDRIESAQNAGQIGALVGAGLPVVGDIIRRGAGAVNQYISPTIARYTQGADAAADKILANKIAREGSSPAAIRADLQRGQANTVLHGGGKTASRATLPETIADTSDSMQRLTGTLYRTGGEAGDYIKQNLDARQKGLSGLFDRVTGKGKPDGQHQRIMNASERALLIKSAGTARQTEAKIVNDMRAQGNKLYDEAYKKYDNFDIQGTLDGLALKSMQYPAPFQARLQRAINLFRVDNNRFPVSTVERFDAAKKALDDMIETAQRQGQGNLTRELAGFKQSLLQSVHGYNAAGAPTRNLAYHKARDAWGSAAENREAIDLGRAALRENSEISVEQFKDLTTGQKQLFRLGFLESLKNSLGPKGRGQDATRIFETNRVRELMAEMMPRSKGSKAAFANRSDRFGSYIDREQRMVATRNAALSGSMTQRNQADDAVFAADAANSMWNRFRQSPSLFNIGVEAVSTGINKVFGYRQDVALAIAKRILEADPTKRNQILRALQKQSPEKYKSFSQFLDQTEAGFQVTLPAQVAEEQNK